jgi:cold shock CspA family protein
MGALIKGRVGWFDRKKDYGFIESDGMPSVFFRISKVPFELQCALDQAEVEFEVVEKRGDLVASKVYFSTTTSGIA